MRDKPRTRTARGLLFAAALLSPLLQDGLPDPVEIDDGLSSALPPAAEVADAVADSPQAMKPYNEPIGTSGVSFDLLPIPGGRFQMGSPEEEQERGRSEGPRHEVALEPFWMGRCEVSWDEYQLFMLGLDENLRAAGEIEATPRDPFADAVSRPTPPYVPMDFDMGVDGFPAVCMTQFAARQYTRWLSMKTGRFYRLPSEAEWEYACRAGSYTAYSFGSDPGPLDEYAWHDGNSDGRYHKVGLKQPNAWGLHDMHGNVAEWVLDAFDRKFYRSFETEEGEAALASSPVNWPRIEFPRVVRGGSWDDEAADLRSATRRGSSRSWKVQDPQIPKSIWYHTNAAFVGFRVVRPLRAPAEAERGRYWDPDIQSMRDILAEQRTGRH